MEAEVIDISQCSHLFFYAINIYSHLLLDALCGVSLV